MSGRLEILTCRGDPRELGRQHGEAARSLIHDHLSLVREGLGSDADGTDPAVLALSYEQAVVGAAPDLAEEIAGLAEGAELTLGEAYLLQVRAEVGALSRDARDGECTTFSVDGTRTAGLGPLAGGNSDLPAMYAPLMIGLRLHPVVGPPVLMATPAGQISYVGMNAHGLALFANSIVCGGWRVGFPRYLLSRIVLRCRTVDEAIPAVQGLSRAASRNLLLCDRSGYQASIETTPHLASVVDADRGLLVHANHFESDDGRAIETAGSEWMADSRRRARRLYCLLDRDVLSMTDVRSALGDREGLPYALSREPDEDGTDNMTVLSSIAAPDAGAIEFASGPPHRTSYHQFAVEE